MYKTPFTETELQKARSAFGVWGNPLQKVLLNALLLLVAN